MRNIKVIIISLFFIVSAAFCAYTSYDQLVGDHTPPMIICDGVPLEVTIRCTTEDLCKGLTATDNIDGDISDRIIIRKISQLVGSNRALIYYVVFDSSSNVCTFNRVMEYTDYQKPHFRLTKPLSYNVSSTVVLSDRLSAFDLLDGDAVTRRIRISSTSVNNTVPGDYPITIQVTNSTGDTAVATLTVRIENSDARQPILELSDYILYVKCGQELSLDTLRGLITNIRESYAGDVIPIEDIEIVSNVDTTVRGSGLVTYSYTNAAGFEKSVLLNVIVE